MNFSLRNARIETLDIVRGDSKPLETRGGRVEFVSIYAKKMSQRLQWVHSGGEVPRRTQYRIRKAAENRRLRLQEQVQNLNL